MFEPEELMARIVDLEEQLKVSEMAPPAAEQLIACLEGEVAQLQSMLATVSKAGMRVRTDRDQQAQRIAELDALSVTKVMLDIVPGDGDGYEVYAKSVSDVETKLGALVEENEDLQFEREQLRAELSAIKAQEPVAEVKHGPLDSSGWPEFVRVKTIGDFDLENLPNGMKLYAAPVSEAKAHGNYAPASVVWIDARHVIEGNNPSFIKDVALVSAERTSETQIPLARLNAAPVQQVGVPAWMASSRAFADRMYMAGWRDHADAQHSGVAGMYDELLSSAPEAPAADAWIQVSERLPDVPDGDEREVIVCVKRAHNGQSYSFSARYLNNFPLHSDSEDEPTFVTGWHDVKEHAEYDGWYSPLIDSSSSDEATHWMPLPAAPSANSAKVVV